MTYYVTIVGQQSRFDLSILQPGQVGTLATRVTQSCPRCKPNRLPAQPRLALVTPAASPAGDPSVEVLGEDVVVAIVEFGSQQDALAWLNEPARASAFGGVAVFLTDPSSAAQQS